MLIVWLKAVIAALLRLVIPPPPENTAICDPCAKCPACGHRQGTIKFERIVQGLVPRLGDPSAQEAADRKAVADAKPAIRHTCAICDCKWYVPVLSVPEFPAL